MRPKKHAIHIAIMDIRKLNSKRQMAEKSFDTVYFTLNTSIDAVIYDVIEDGFLNFL